MNVATENQPNVTILYVPREKFSLVPETLKTLYENTDYPFDLICVDTNSPSKIKKYLVEQSQLKKFELVRINQYIPPNHAKNIGLRYIDFSRTDYVVFLDNDVFVTPGWLKALVNCAEETGAAVVGPLVCESGIAGSLNASLNEIIHVAGGEARITTDVSGERYIHFRIDRQGQKLTDVCDQLQRIQTEFIEVHCILVKSGMLQKVSFFDSAVPSFRDHIDFSLSVAQAGGTLYLEPASVVTFVAGSLEAGSLTWSDLPYYMLRWSDAWYRDSLDRLQAKWSLAADRTQQLKNKGTRWRRNEAILRPLRRRLSQTLKVREFWMGKLLDVFDVWVCRYLINRYDYKKNSCPAALSPDQTPSLVDSTPVGSLN